MPAGRRPGTNKELNGMRMLAIAVVLAGGIAPAGAQTAEDLVARNVEAKGGREKIKAINTLRMRGKLVQGNFTAQVGQELKRPGKIRSTLTVQGMTAVQAYDGQTGWQISPFQGRKDPELVGDDDLRDLVEDADIDGPLVDYREKGHAVEYLGRDTVDGDDAYRLKCTLKNGDIVYYYLDPDTFLEIRTERQQFIRGAMRERQTDLGSYKPVAGVMYPFSTESGPKNNPSVRSKVSIEAIEANVPLDDSLFRMPAVPAGPSAPKLPDPPLPGPSPTPKPPSKPPVKGS
jgi:hypothetical protein